MAKKRKRAAVPQQETENDGDNNNSAPNGTNHKPDPDGKGTAQHGDDPAASTLHDIEHYQVPFNDKTIACERRGQAGKPSLIFTHGAGGGLSAPATKDFADGFAEQSSVVSFKGSMNLPSRTKAFHAVMEHEEFDAALGGRSMGARAAAIAATQQDRQTNALVLVSFPLVGGKKNESREQILLDLPETMDVLLISGNKDNMCDLEHLDQVRSEMNACSWLVVVEAADHGMSWKWKDGVQEMRRETGVVAAKWLKGRDRSKRHCVIRWDEEVGELRCGDWEQSEKPAQEMTGEEGPPAKKKRKAK